MLQQKKYPNNYVFDTMKKYMNAQDKQVVKSFGSSSSTSFWDRGKARGWLVDAITAYDEDWHRKHRGQPEEREEDRKQDEFQRLVNSDTARARSAF